MPFWRTYYHIIWATKNRNPIITDDIKMALLNYIQTKSNAYGCLFHAIGGTADHIHVVLSIPPKISVAQLVGKLKEGSAYFVNHYLEKNKKSFEWQKSYGVLSFGAKQLPFVTEYVSNQEKHHLEKTAIKILETDYEVSDDI